MGLIAAGLFISWGLFEVGTPASDPVGFIAMVWTTYMAASIFGSLSVIPSLVAILCAEFMSLRSVVYHVAVGGVIALVLWSLGGQIPSDVNLRLLRPGSSIAASAGFIGGFVYWIIAGRLSGIWRILLRK